jgi:histidinol phosphatase-like enzyme
VRNSEFESGKGKKSHKKAILFDLDGTIADTEDAYALHKIDHPTFLQEVKDAEPFPNIVAKVKEAKDKGRDVVIMTARSAHYRKETKEWLSKHDIPYDALYMRHAGDERKDKKVKKELLEQEVLPNFNIKKAYDDKKKNVKMFRKEGINAKRVND